MVLILGVIFCEAKMKKVSNKKIEKALLDKALGYETKEVIEEYGLSGDELVLQKRKTSVKTYPPDLSALQMLLERRGDGDLSGLTDEELEQEKKRLIKLLKEEK